MFVHYVGKIKMRFQWMDLCLIFSLGCLVGGCFISHKYIHKYEKILPAFYCVPSTGEKRNIFIIECLQNPKSSIEDCELTSLRLYGVSGFSKGGRVYPCFKAKTIEEKEICGDR